LRALIPLLILLSTRLALAVTALPSGNGKLPTTSLLPDGSQMHGVLLPRYDENQKLSSLLHAEAMTLVDRETIHGDTVCIEFFDSDETMNGRIDLRQAVFNSAKGSLKATEIVTLSSDQIIAKGDGLWYAFEQGEGFLGGPVDTRIFSKKQTTMKSRTSTLRATAMVGAALAQPALNAAPPPSAPAERAAVHADAVSKAPAQSNAASETRSTLKTDLEASAAATANAKAFLEKQEIQAKADTAPATPEAQPLEAPTDPNDTLVTCDGGMYFDADDGVFVYLRNVVVKDPRFDLSGANELKVFLGKKPQADAAKDAQAKSKNGKGIGLGARFGDVERIVATGAVRVLQKQTEPAKLPVEASGAIFTYHPKTGRIHLQGGYPWVKQGTNFMRAKEPKLSLRIEKDGSFVTEGRWDMRGKVEDKNKP
jgi:lipopolysaccharide export system protein LptA